MIRKLAHVGIATRSLSSLLRVYRELGLQVSTSEVLHDQKVRLVVLQAGDSAVELLEPTAPDSVISRFIERRGEGIHHIALEVDDLVRSLRQLKEKNFELIDEIPRRGARDRLIAFIHPRSTGGVLVELTQTLNESEE